MSLVTVMSPAKDETYDDYLTSLIYDAAKGNEKEKKWGEFYLKLIAMGELLEDLDKDCGESEKKDPRHFIKVYNKEESVNKDLSLYDYGISPLIKHLFPVMNTFAVSGKLGKNKSGFSVDFYSKLIQPTKTNAYIGGNSKKKLRSSAEKIFSFLDVDNNPAYHELSLKRKKVNSELYAGKKDFVANVCDGEIIFRDGKTSQNEIMSKMMQNIKTQDLFVPEKYIIRGYDFAIDTTSYKSEEKFKAHYTEIMQKVHAILEKKAKKTAA